MPNNANETSAHHRGCLNMTLDAIGENNAQTIEDNEVSGTTRPDALTPETDEMAEVWLAEGNTTCRCDEDATFLACMAVRY